MTPTDLINAAAVLYPGTELQLAAALRISRTRLRAWRGIVYKSTPRNPKRPGGTCAPPTQDDAIRVILAVRDELQSRHNTLTGHLASLARSEG